MSITIHRPLKVRPARDPAKISVSDSAEFGRSEGDAIRSSVIAIPTAQTKLGSTDQTPLRSPLAGR